MKNNNELCFDYSSNKREFMTFGYSSPTDGTYLIDDVVQQTGFDFRNLEQYIYYKESGLNVMMLQTAFGYDGSEPWEDSLAKRMMDLCTEAGIKKTIMTDLRLHKLSSSETPIVGPGCRFANQEECNAYVAECMKDYVKEPQFLGLLIQDEPRHWVLPAYGSICKAIKAYKPDCYLESNLLPYMDYCQVRDFYAEHEDGMTVDEGYVKYLDKYLANSNPDKLLMDDYPFMADRVPYRMLNQHMRCCQICADYCAEHNLRFEAVAQTFAGSANGGKHQWWAPQNMDTMQWQINLYLMLGVKTFGYFTYWRKQCNRTNGEWYNDGTSFMRQNGQKTELYCIMQTIHKEMQLFAPTMYDFKYLSSTFIAGKDTVDEQYYLVAVKKEKLGIVDESDIKGGDDAILFASELVNEETGDHMLAILNINNPYLEDIGKETSTDYEVKFGKEYKGVKVYYRGKNRIVDLDNGVYRGHLGAGYAEYLIPFKK